MASESYFIDMMIRHIKGSGNSIVVLLDEINASIRCKEPSLAQVLVSRVEEDILILEEMFVNLIKYQNQLKEESFIPTYELEKAFLERDFQECPELFKSIFKKLQKLKVSVGFKRLVKLFAETSVEDLNALNCES